MKKIFCVALILLMLVGVGIGLTGCFLDPFRNETPHQAVRRFLGVDVPKDATVEFFHAVRGRQRPDPAFTEFFAIFRLQGNLTEEFLEIHSFQDNGDIFYIRERRFINFDVPRCLWPNWESRYLDNGREGSIVPYPSVFYFPETLKLIFGW